MLVSMTRSLSCRSGAEIDASFFTAEPCRINCTTIGIWTNAKTPREYPAPRSSGTNYGKRDARHGKTTPARPHGSRIAVWEPIRLRRRFSVIMPGVDNGRTPKIRYTQNHAKNRAATKNERAQIITKALVAAGDKAKRRARSQARRVQADECEENRGFAQAV